AVNVMAANDTGPRVDGNVPGGEDILPPRFSGSGGLNSIVKRSSEVEIPRYHQNPSSVCEPPQTIHIDIRHYALVPRNLSSVGEPNKSTHGHAGPVTCQPTKAITTYIFI
ncbi:MAG: hypothetical protein ACRDGA_13455, partial [Bacteroidota bacterium]